MRQAAGPDAPSARVVNMMTVDVEEHFQVSALASGAPRHQWDDLESRVEANTEAIVAIFAEARVHATFFVLGWVGARLPHLVRRLVDLGHEVASHGYAHELLYELSPAQFREDLRRSKAILEDACGRQIVGYRAPSYSVTRASLWALDILIEEGFQYDASIFPIHHDRYGIPQSPRGAYTVTSDEGSLVEIPGSTVRIGPVNLPIAGGGYFRILPYAWTRWGIARLNRVERQPAIFYLHPWELDPDQPRLPAPALGRFRHYRNLAQTGTRLRRLLREFAFAPVSTVLFDPVAAGQTRYPVALREAW